MGAGDVTAYFNILHRIESKDFIISCDLNINKHRLTKRKIKIVPTNAINSKHPFRIALNSIPALKLHNEIRVPACQDNCTLM
jgi:hypothetical protein